MNYRNFENNIHDKLYNVQEDMDVSQFIIALNNKRNGKSKVRWIGWISMATVIIMGGLWMLHTGSVHITAQGRTLTQVDHFVHQSSNSKDISATSNNGQDDRRKSDVVKDDATKVMSAAKDRMLSSDHKLSTASSAYSYALSSRNFIPQSTDIITSPQQQSLSHIQSHNQDALSSHSNLPEVAKNNDGTTSTYQDKQEIETLTVEADGSALRTHIALAPAITVLHSGLKFQRKLPVFGSKDIQCPSFVKKSKMQFSFIPEVGYFLPIQKLANPGEEQSDVFALRDKNEKSLEGLQAAMYVQAQKKGSPFFVKAGINYARFTERMSLSYSYIQKDTTVGIISITVSPGGDTITTIYGNIITETTRTGNKIAHHGFQLLDIPIAIGFERPMSSFKVGGEVGAMINVSMQATGKILDSTTDFKQIGIYSPYRKNIGINYFASLFVSKEFGEQHSIYLALRGRFIPSTFTKTGTAITEKYTFAGLHLGYKILF